MLQVSPFASPFAKSPFPAIEKSSTLTTRQEKNNTYLNFAADRAGCYFYRRGFLENFINLADVGNSTTVYKMIFDKNWYRDVRCVTLQRQASSEQKQFFQFLKSIQPEMGFKIIYEVDDVVFREDIPDYNIYKHAFDDDAIRQNCIDMINMADEVTVTCKFMQELYRQKAGKQEITVVPNFMPYSWIGHQYDYNKIIGNFDSNKRKPRIVYAGSGAHFDVKNLNGGVDDFSHVMKFVVDNIDKYQFVFIGSFPPALKPFIDSKKIEFHPWQSLAQYPNFLASLNAQLFLAPLNDNNFNKAKSDIKFIEACQLGIPCLCQDIETYSNAPEFLRFHDSEDLEVKVDQILNWKNRSQYYKMVPELRKVGATRFLELEPNFGSFIEAFNTPYNDPRRRWLRQWN